MSSINIDRTNRKNTGKSFEAELAIVFAEMERAGSARIRKVDPPLRVLSGGRKVIPLPNPFLDYVGASGGRAVFIEAKSTSSHRLPFKRSGGLTEAQVENILAWEKVGAIVGVLWAYDGRIRLIGVEEIKAAVRERKKSFAFGELRPGCEHVLQSADCFPRPLQFWTAVLSRFESTRIL